jgi:hypothetical protein
VIIRRGNKVVAQNVTNHLGIARFNDIAPGTYHLSAHFVGYYDFNDTVQIDETHSIDSAAMHSISQQEVVISATQDRELNVTSFDLSNGNQVFESETYHAPPTVNMTNLVQENLLGAARAPTGEVHIRGQHGEYTYYIDGIPVPLGVFGGLNDVIDPKVIDRSTFYTGGFPAEYGGQIAAVIDLQNRVPAGPFHLDFSTYGGSYLTSDTLGTRVGSFKAVNSNGQSLALSSQVDKLGIFLSGSRQETDRRIDPPTAEIFNDHGFDYFLYGKIDYRLSDIDYLTANLNYGRTNTQVPYDSVRTAADYQDINDNQITTNQFQTLSYFRAISTEKDAESNLFIGAYAREGELNYIPGKNDAPDFYFAPDTANNVVLAEDRTFTTLGVRTKYDVRLSHQFMYAAGLNFSSTTGNEDYTSFHTNGTPGDSSFVSFNGSDFGMFGETEWHPLEWTKLELGLRYDQHIAPDISLQSQVSPRVKLNFLIDESNSAYLYYGKLFMPTNIEGLRTIAENAANAAIPTLPERDNFYEAVYTRSFPSGLKSKLAAFYKHATPGVDDETIGSSAIKTPVNIDTVNTTGIELGLSYSDPSTPFSGYLNSALTHAYGIGKVAGGFTGIAGNDSNGTDLDHDQRLSIVASLNYQPLNWFVNASGIYGSGLTNGAGIYPYGTGLFDFNTKDHTAPSWIFDLSGGYTFQLRGTQTITPSLYFSNILDHLHLIKGAYFSGASYEEPRNVVFKIAYHI